MLRGQRLFWPFCRGPMYSLSVVDVTWRVVLYRWRWRRYMLPWSSSACALHCRWRTPDTRADIAWRCGTPSRHRDETPRSYTPYPAPTHASILLVRLSLNYFEVLITPPLPPPGREAECCDERECLSICFCLSVREHISGTTLPIFANFLRI